ncbi:aminoglycoside phosphotransferase family protein [Pseudorhodobacter sp.]|uniref:aminoglycoside phosphotransferase family protein n=1 Tax=Pseudorhodobacter sp. TaxID=1934400 RepID=UPI002648E70B|nr:phosphotransferase [Pseudorhodobacter sp.]MDN5785815.1 phosphotransferase [Pseudorhodobacter sp.]
MSDRKAASLAFLANAGWADASRSFLAGDASDRSYDRLRRGTKTAVLMDAPPGKGDDPADFIAIGAHLNRLGLSAPRVLAQDLAQGFLLIEDLGDDVFAGLIAKEPQREVELYAAATDVLTHLQSHPAPKDLPDLSAMDWAKAAAFALDWYRFAVTGNRVDTQPFVATLTRLIQHHADGPRVLILRDYHAENLLWLPERSGTARVGLLDFQLGQMGQPGYDLVSLLQDARRDVSVGIEVEMIQRFRPDMSGDFLTSYAVLGAQRGFRILGIFARLCLVAGKPHYVTLIPRVWQYLQRNLRHPALAPLATICNIQLPEPTPEALERIRAQCGKHPMP